MLCYVTVSTTTFVTWKCSRLTTNHHPCGQPSYRMKTWPRGKQEDGWRAFHRPVLWREIGEIVTPGELWQFQSWFRLSIFKLEYENKNKGNFQIACVEPQWKVVPTVDIMTLLDIAHKYIYNTHELYEWMITTNTVYLPGCFFINPQVDVWHWLIAVR